MPSCLGIYIDKNIIKYAKVTSDKATAGITLDAHGVKFYDNVQATVAEIAEEVDMRNGPISVALSNEEYYMTQVFSNLKKKDMMELILAEYSEKNTKEGIPTSIMEMRFKLAQNIGVLDKNLALCVSTSKAELANINQNFSEFKIASIEPLPVSIKNLFANEAIDEESIVINIEDKTTITLFTKNEIQHLESFELGAEEIINQLAIKYNSTAKAYEACKSVSVYADDIENQDGEAREILDVIIPVLYDIRQRVEAIVEPYNKIIKKVYITGTAAIINNVDLYFQQIFAKPTCEVLIPFFIRKDNPKIKEIIEVNSALALALDGIGMASPEYEFSLAAKKVLGTKSLKDFAKKIKLDKAKKVVTEKFNELKAKLPAFASKGKKKRGKVKIDFVEGSADIASIANDDESDEEKTRNFDALAGWLRRLAIMLGMVLAFYSVVAVYSANQIDKKNTDTLKQISLVNANVSAANQDATFLRGQAEKYIEITNKLKAIITKINEQTSRGFDIPNFLSKVMFIMPANVVVTSIDVSETGNVLIKAESGQHAQLGYLVSRIKLEKILLDVNMEVVDMSGNIKILISGVLP